MAEKKKNLRFQNDMKEAASTVRPVEKGYTRSKSRLKGMDAGKEKLRYGRKEIQPEAHRSNHLSSEALTARLHARIAQTDEDDNAGTEAVNRGTETAEEGVQIADDTINRTKYASKLRDQKRESKLQQDAEPEGLRQDHAGSSQKTETADHKKPEVKKQGNANPFSRWRQKQQIKKEYAAARAGKVTENGTAAAESTGKAAKETKNLITKMDEFVSEHSGAFVIFGILVVLLLFVVSTFSSCSTIAGGSGGGVLGSSYTAEDSDIIGANNDYKALEEELQNQIDNIERTHPGYDEYQYELANINHNPYVLTSYLTVLYEDYTREEVQQKLQELFAQQYKLTLREEVQTRTRTETRTGHRTVHNEDGTTDTEEYEYEVEVEYQYYILHVKLVNNTLEQVIANAGLTEDQTDRYNLLNETKGNRAYLFEDDVYANPDPGEYTDYDIPGEALTNEKFANMMAEAEKYLGYPYVWGGSSPSTSFDCSGFVCWVINHSGNGWNVGRTTAEGLRQKLAIIPKSEAQPGDIIFFQGTYNTPGASHVGIYVGNGMMIHCGNPIQYASINSSYFQQHFMCFGRLP